MARYEYLIYLRQYHARDKHTRTAAQPVVKVEWKGGGGVPGAVPPPKLLYVLVLNLMRPGMSTIYARSNQSQNHTAKNNKNNIICLLN